MKKFLVSSFTFIVAMLPLGLLSTSNDNSADVNHDGEVNISDVNAVIDIILGGAYEGYSGDVNHDGEVTISDINYLIDIILGKQITAVPVINTQIVDNAVIITAVGNGNVCLYVNGLMVTNPYVAIRGEVDYEVSVYATAQESGKLMSQSETINILIPALTTTATPVITTETTNEAVIITATGNGNVCLYVDGVVVDNPYVAVRGEVDYEITVYATAQESGKLMSQCESIIVLIPAMPITATPVVTTNITEAAVIITASGDGIVKLFVNDLLVENPYTAIRSNVDYELIVYATAQEEGKVLSQSNNQTIIVPALDNHDWVDLGLPSGTLWATMNVGANSPEEYGDRFAWGETAPKNEYSWNTYKWCNGNYNTLTKYCTNSSFGPVDNKTELEPEDDAACVNWGEKWRMPSYDQLTELLSKCTWTWMTLNGVNGYVVTGPNGASLFLPTAGENSGSLTGLYGFYWSRTLDTSDSKGAFDLHFGSGDVGWNGSNRCRGMTVRPVHVSLN